MTGTHGREGTLQIRFSISGRQLEIDGTGAFQPGDKIRTDLTEFSKRILHTVVDSASLQAIDGKPRFNLVKTIQ